MLAPRHIIAGAVVVGSSFFPSRAGADIVHGGVYLDIAHLHSSTQPGNQTWRTKGTSAFLDEPVVNNLTVFLGKEATIASRWGFSAGYQSGKDVDELATSGAISSADTQKHLYYTNLTYLFPVGRGLSVMGGLIPGNIGYESFHAIENPTYTREYGVDLVPYFHWGLWATYPVDGSFTAGLLVVNSWDYLSVPNNAVSLGAQLDWSVTDDVTLTQNFYYGPEQTNTSVDFWRFVAQTIAEWRAGAFLFAASVAYGTEKRDRLLDTPRFGWAWGALWARWEPRDRWGFTVRPEFYNDDDGAMTGARQKLRALTLSSEYRFSPQRMNLLSARLEYRFDRSTGPDGGFFEGDSNMLVPDQHVFILALMWRFDTAGEGG